ncbi:Ubiquitin-fold modifier-conjugating enzyme 1, partial [Ataeniobius toweri]|nr:Ubiquitin-fold modifier-conjugating enzyme 1 [Ataeniobius toweri]
TCRDFCFESAGNTCEDYNSFRCFSSHVSTSEWSGADTQTTRSRSDPNRGIMADEATRRAVSQIPLLKTHAGPRERALWPQRLKEEYQALIRFVEQNKAADNDWFRLESNPEGTRWTGTCWFVHQLLRYEFRVEFDIPVTYPETAPEVAVPELDGKTAKMFRGGKICLTEHFAPLWARNVPRFGIAHLMALGLAPWLAVEIPDLISKGHVVHKEKQRDVAE